ncbi:MAG TPA: ABC transporter ATP-binding protein [Limnochordales bacterium]
MALARALVSEPKIILFDEPLSNLDAKLREETRRDLRRLLTQLGLTALYVTHDRHEALALSDLVVVMKDGAIVEAGSPKDIYFRPKTRFVVEFLGGTNFLEATVLAHEAPWTRVRTPLGELLCEGRPDMVPGQRATVYIRTDAIRPEPMPALMPELMPDPGPAAEAAAANRFRGRIRSLIFLGEHYDAEVAAGPQDTPLTVRLAAGLDVHEGQELDLLIDPAGCRLLE